LVFRNVCRGAGNAQVLMKGNLHADELMKTGMPRDTGLLTSRCIRSNGWNIASDVK
jgi:hypothetical protein